MAEVEVAVLGAGEPKQSEILSVWTPGQCVNGASVVSTDFLRFLGSCPVTLSGCVFGNLVVLGVKHQSPLCSRDFPRH